MSSKPSQIYFVHGVYDQCWVNWKISRINSQNHHSKMSALDFVIHLPKWKNFEVRSMLYQILIRVDDCANKAANRIMLREKGIDGFSL